MKRNLSVSFALAVAATLVALIANPAYATNCNNATLTGNYGVISPGFITAAPAKAINLSQDAAAAVVGVMAFDGTGGVTDTHTFSLQGVIFQGRVNSGTYTVGSDCTGSISYTSGITFNIVVVGGGTEILGIVTTPTFIQTFDAKKE